MTSIREIISRLFSPIQPVTPGMYHYQAPPEDPRNYRLHLRIETGGSGVLIVNAATVLHLNQTAAEYAYYLVQNIPPDAAAAKIAKRYEVDREQARQDYLNLIERIQALINTPDLDPVTFLDFERHTPLGGSISAPYRLDCALTYKLPDGAAPESAPVDRVVRELNTAEWKTVLDKSWQAGIPHLVFTGGEPTLRADLPELLYHAETHGQVTGLISDGLRLADPAYLDSLLQTGLDHLEMIFRPDDQAAWQALENVLLADLFVAVHLTLTPENQAEIPRLLERLATMGVRAISLSASDPNLKDSLQAARERVASLDMELVWNLPVPYSAQHPVALEIPQAESPDGAGRAWLYVEPDGDVLPGQGVNRKLGNLVSDEWEKVWRK